MNELQIRWQPCKTGARILQVYTLQLCIEIPESIAGLPVTEIGPYCFSASAPKDILAKDDEHILSFSASEPKDNPVKDDEHILSFSASEPKDIPAKDDEHILSFSASEPKNSLEIPAPTLPPLEGRYVEEIILPSGVQVLHNAAFYNCRRLISLSVGDSIKAIGSDEFTNCSRLTRLIYRSRVRSESAGGEPDMAGLSLILGRIETDLEVFFQNGQTPGTPNSGFSDPALPSGINPTVFDGALFFPEYYEWLDEVSPAHLFSRSINGEGFRMRKCISDGRLDYGKYDACFENALATESPETLCRIAMDRLRWPGHLSESCRLLYRETLQKHLETALSMAVKTRDFSLLQFLFTAFTHDYSVYSQAIRLTTEADWGEGAAWLMEKRHGQHGTGKKTYIFDDF